jgi:hypothetical protein
MAYQQVITPEGRFRWVNIYSPKKNYKGNKNVRSVALLIPKTSSLKLMQDAYNKCAAAEFKGKVPASMRKLIGGQKPIIRDGDEIYSTRDDDKKPMYEEYIGCWVIQPDCEETFALQIRDAQGAVLVDPAEIYDGAYGQLVVNFNSYMSKPAEGYLGGPMMSIHLLMVKKTRDGEPIEGTGGPKALTEADVSQYFGAAADSTDDL